MLDPEAPDELRDRIVSDARGRIEAAGTLKHDTAWGMRNMAYEIRRRTEADYRFFRFESESSLLDALDHELKIADGVLRFRIFKVDPRSPVVVPPAPTPGSGPPARPTRTDSAEPASAEVPAEPAAEAAPAEGAAEPPADPPAAGTSDEVAVEPVDHATPPAPEPAGSEAEGEASGGAIPEAPAADAETPAPAPDPEEPAS
jgi:ribosomal protein S6